MLEMIVKHRSQPLHQGIHGRGRHMKEHSGAGPLMASPSPNPTPLKTLELTLWLVGFTGVLMHLFTGRPVSLCHSPGREQLRAGPHLCPSWAHR